VTVSGFIQQTGIVSPDADIMDAARIFGMLYLSPVKLIYIQIVYKNPD